MMKMTLFATRPRLPKPRIKCFAPKTVEQEKVYCQCLLNVF
jgi:hypothetical protein